MSLPLSYGNPKLGAAVRAWRLRKSMTQQRLSERLDVSKAFISAVEAGRRRPKG